MEHLEPVKSAAPLTGSPEKLEGLPELELDDELVELDDELLELEEELLELEDEPELVVSSSPPPHAIKSDDMRNNVKGLRIVLLHSLYPGLMF